MSPLTLWSALVSVKQHAFFKPHKHQWPRVPLPAPICSLRTSFLNCLLSPMLPFTQPKLSGNSLLMVPLGDWLFGVRWKNYLLGQLKFPAHEMQEQSGDPQSEEDGISHVLCVSPKACIPMKIAPLPFFLSPPSEWGAREKRTLCHSRHLSVSPSLPSSGNSVTNSAPAFQLTKVLCMSLPVYRYTKFDRWTISSTNSNPPSPVLDSATLLCNVNFLIPDFFCPIVIHVSNHVFQFWKIWSTWLWGLVLALIPSDSQLSSSSR